MVCGHCLVTLSLTINETLKWLSLLPILRQKSFWWWQCSNRYIICLFAPLSLTLISLMVSVDVKHHVYLKVSPRGSQFHQLRPSASKLAIPLLSLSSYHEHLEHLLAHATEVVINIIDHFYIVLFSTLEQTHCARMWFYMSEYLFIVCFWISTEVVYLQRWRGWCHMKLLPSRRVLCTPYNHAPCHFMQSHIHEVYACLAVTCHLHFWRNDQDLLRATELH